MLRCIHPKLLLAYTFKVAPWQIALHIVNNTDNLHGVCVHCQDLTAIHYRGLVLQLNWLGNLKNMCYAMRFREGDTID